jgi:hypothetical protein
MSAYKINSLPDVSMELIVSVLTDYQYQYQDCSEEMRFLNSIELRFIFPAAQM